MALVVAAEFGLGDVISSGRPDHGSSDVRLVDTKAGSYVLKRWEDRWQAELYDAVQEHLNAKGVRQARLLRTIDGSLVTPDGYSIQQRLPGGVVISPSAQQCQAVFDHLARYDAALADLVGPRELYADTIWTRTASAEYLVAHLPELRAPPPPER